MIFAIIVTLFNYAMPCKITVALQTIPSYHKYFISFKIKIFAIIMTILSSRFNK